MPTVKLLGGLRKLVASDQRIDATTVAEILRRVRLPPDLLFPAGRLNPDVEVLVNGRNIAFLNGVNTTLESSDRVTIFLHGARGYPGG